MSRILELFKALTKDWLRSKTGVFFTFLFPIILLLIFSAVFSGQSSPEYSLHVQNKDLKENGDPTNLSKSFVNSLNSTEVLKIREIDEGVDVSSWLESNQSYTESRRVLVIPSNFSDQAINRNMKLRMRIILDTVQRIRERSGSNLSESDLNNIEEGEEQVNESLSSIGSEEPAKIRIITSDGDQSRSIIRGIVNNVMSSFNNKLLGANGSSIDLEMNSLTVQNVSSVDYYLPGILAAFIMTNGIMGVTSSISEYNRNGVLKRMAATPLPKKDWIIANLLQQALLAFILTGVMILLGRIIFDVNAIPGPLSIALILLGSTAFCSIGITLGGTIKDVESATGLGNAIAFPLMFLSGVFFPLEIMPNYLQTIAKLSPLYYFHIGLRELMIFNQPQNSYTAFIILGTIAITFTIIATKTTKWKEIQN